MLTEPIPMAVPLMRIADIGVLLVSLLIFWRIYRQRLFRSRYQGNRGRWLFFGGIVMLVAIMVLELTMKVSSGDTGYLQNPIFLPVNVPMPLQWLMTRTGFLLLVFGAWYALLERRQADRQYALSQERMIEAAQDSVLQLEGRFRGLLDTTSAPVFCWSLPEPVRRDSDIDELRRGLLQAELVDCNPEFLRVLNLGSMANAMGLKLGELPLAQDDEAFTDVVRAMRDNDFALKDYEMSFTPGDGRTRLLSMTLTGIFDDGRLSRVWGSQTDLQKIRAAEAALRRRQGFQELVAGISSYMIMTPIEKSAQIIEHCLEEVCRFIGADRSSLYWLDEDGASAHASYRWGRGGDLTPGRIEEEQFPNLARVIRSGRAVRIDDVRTEPAASAAESALLDSWGIRALVALPMTLEGRLIGTVSFATSDEARAWTDQDILDLRVVAELFASVVSRLRSHQALASALDELEDAKERLEAENIYLREEFHLSTGFDDIVGRSESILKPLRMVEMVADTDTPVLILGETGTGKELIARALHQRSSRKDRPMVRVNCATLPDNLIESELFGYEKGAFTGADQRKIGRFDLADKSTLFLDEFGELPLELQTKLLRVLQEGEFERLGGTETHRVDVRIVVATNQDLKQLVQRGAFRSDLYYRVNTFPINVPPLRERDGDVELLAYHFLDLHSRRMGREFRGISASMMQQLKQYDWPGNVRELEGVVQRAMIASAGDVLELPEPLVRTADPAAPQALGTTIADLKQLEKEHILNALEQCGWKISGPNGAARMLDLPPSTLRSRMKKLSISKPA